MTGFNFGKLARVSRTVAVQTVLGVGVGVVAVANTRSFDHDLAGRLARETHAGFNGNVYSLETDYWLDGAVRRKRLADGSWTGLFS